MWQDLWSGDDQCQNEGMLKFFFKLYHPGELTGAKPWIHVSDAPSAVAPSAEEQERSAHEFGGIVMFVHFLCPSAY